MGALSHTLNTCSSSQAKKINTWWVCVEIYREEKKRERENTSYCSPVKEAKKERERREIVCLFC
jgi:hypothetical protein